MGSHILRRLRGIRGQAQAMNLAPGDVVIVDFGAFPFGHEQAGTRPAIFISITNIIAMVIPLTSNVAKQRYDGTVVVNPDGYNNLAKQSLALAFHIRSIDKRRIQNRIGALSASDVRAINKIVRTITLIDR